MKQVPLLPRLLGLAGLVPQWACAMIAWFGPEEWYYTALALGFGYAALIFSFLGGLWWGLASAASKPIPGWLWVAAIAPNLVAFASYVPWILGLDWPQPSLIILAGLVLASLAVDQRLMAFEAPAWWMELRVPLSIGLAVATLLLGLA